MLCKSCRILEAYLTLLDIIHEHNVLLPMTASHYTYDSSSAVVWTPAIKENCWTTANLFYYSLIAVLLQFYCSCAGTLALRGP